MACGPPPQEFNAELQYLPMHLIDHRQPLVEGWVSFWNWEIPSFASFLPRCIHISLPIHILWFYEYILPQYVGRVGSTEVSSPSQNMSRKRPPPPVVFQDRDSPADDGSLSEVALLSSGVDPFHFF